MVNVAVGDSRLMVAEVKAFKRRRDRLKHFKTQLLAYALLVNESIGIVREAILYHGGEVLRVGVTWDMLVNIEKKVRKLRAIIESEKPPQVTQPRQKCTYCWYRRVCPTANP